MALVAPHRIFPGQPRQAPGWPAALLILLCAAAAPGATPAPDAGERDLTRELVIGAPEQYFPYSYVGPDGTIEGFSGDLTGAVARRMGLKVRLKAIPNSDLADALSRGEVDAVSFIADSAAREKVFDFSVPVVELEEAVVVRENDAEIRRLQDLQGRRIAVGPSSSHGERIALHFVPGAVPVYTEKWEESLELVQSSKCAGAIMSRFRALALIDTLGLKGLKLMDAKLTGFTYRIGYAVRKGDSLLLARVNEGLVVLHADGEFDRIYQKWFGRYEKTKLTEQQVLLLVAAVLAFGFVVSSLAFLRQRRLSRRIAAQASELDEQRALLSTLFENHPLATVVVDLAPGGSPRIVSVNREVCRLFALDGKGAPGSSLDALGLKPALLRLLTDLLDRYLATGNLASSEVSPAGTGLVLETSVLAIGAAPAGRRRVCVLIADVTRRRMIDLEVTQARRVHALGELVGGIAHEFNNLLTPILATANMLRDEHRDDAGLAGDLGLIEQASLRAADLTRRLLTFGRRSAEQPASVRLADAVANCFALMHTTMDRRIALKADLPEDLPSVEANPTDLHQILFNLLINGRDALVEKLAASGDRSWAPALVVRAEALAPDRVSWTPGARRAPPAGWVRITVEDNGVGIAPEVLERIFDPFFSTKSVGKGTGLGLSTVWHLVAEAGGTVRAESEPGRGARFTVTLRMEADGAPARAHAGGAAAPDGAGAGRSALVVEDDPLVARTTAALLERLGCRASIAEDGEKALKAFASDLGGFWLLMVDLNMPKVSGVEFVRRVRAASFQGRIVIISGNLSDADADALSELKVDGILPKPFTLAELSAALEAAPG